MTAASSRPHRRYALAEPKSTSASAQPGSPCRAEPPQLDLIVNRPRERVIARLQ
jgi:hypothetical protein